jgi:membrane protease YdiL (CAAX protease family)
MMRAIQWKMFKKAWNISKNIVNRLLLIVVWLIILDACTRLGDLPAILCGLGALWVFYWIHVRLTRPRGWDVGRLAIKKPEHFYYLVVLALVLVLGDAFWIFHVKTSQSVFIEDPIDFMVLAIIAFPVIEEFGFRLWLQSYLESKMNPFLAVILVAFAFACFHKPEMPIPQLLSGTLYGIVLIKTKSVWIPIILHMFHNGILIIADKIPVIRVQSFLLMDRQDHLNLYIAILCWLLGITGIIFWTMWNEGKVKMVNISGKR